MKVKGISLQRQRRSTSDVLDQGGTVLVVRGSGYPESWVIVALLGRDIQVHTTIRDLGQIPHSIHQGSGKI